MDLTEEFEAQRQRLHAVAHRMLGSHAEADDAVQEAWLRLTRADRSDVENLGGWLTTVVSRVCLNQLRARTTRREDPLDVVIAFEVEDDPADEVLLGDAVGLALLVVLDALPPAERLAFVLHDMFGVSFDEIATIVDRSPAAARQLASRARRRVRGVEPSPADVATQRRVVDAFFAAARGGDFEALVAVLDPDIVLRADALVVRGASNVAGRALMFSTPDRITTDVVVNGGPGVLVHVDGELIGVMAFTVVDDRIVAIDNLADPDRLAALGLP